MQRAEKHGYDRKAGRGTGRPSWPRPRTAIAAVAACLALLAGFGVVNAMMSVSGTAPIASDDNSGPSFSLVAYAAEKQDTQADGGSALSVNDFFLTAAGGGYTSGSTESLDLDRTYDLNLACAGDGIAGVTYAIDGPEIYFSKWHTTDGSDTDLMFAENIVEDRSQTAAFTIDSASGNSGDIRSNLVLRYTTDDAATVDAYKNLESVSHDDSASRDELSAAFRQLFLAEIREDAKRFSQTPLTVTVSFEDGSTQTKRYLITLVDDYEQVYASTAGTRGEIGRLFKIEEIA